MSGEALMTVGVVFVEGDSSLIQVTVPESGVPEGLTVSAPGSLPGLLARPWDSVFNGQRHGIAYGLRGIPLRNTRHTCSSLLVALKVHPKAAQRILRHSQIATTMEVYAEGSDEEVRSVLGKLPNAMDGSGIGPGAD